jgi:tripartite-type tricarboxylate transporter receptor subunit TctC
VLNRLWRFGEPQRAGGIAAIQADAVMMRLAAQRMKKILFSKRHMKNRAHAYMLVTVALGFPHLAAAQPYPSKSIRMIIPAAPGGGIDTVGRAVGPKVAEALGQPVVPDNKPGAASMIGSELTAKAAPDGYTFLMMTNSHAINAAVRKNLRYDPVKDFAEISLLVVSPYLLVVHPSVPVKTVRELVELARRRPGALHFGSAGSASATHLAGELFNSMFKTNIVHVPYKGGTPAVVDLVGGHVQLMFNNLIAVMPLVKSGRLRALAVTSAKRMSLLPEMPTVAEAGVAGYEAALWYGAMLPAGTPSPIVATLNRELVKAVKANDVHERLASEGYEVIGSTPEEMARYLRADIERWRKVVGSLGLQID